MNFVKTQGHSMKKLQIIYVEFEVCVIYYKMYNKND